MAQSLLSQRKVVYSVDDLPLLGPESLCSSICPLLDMGMLSVSCVVHTSRDAFFSPYTFSFAGADSQNAGTAGIMIVFLPTRITGTLNSFPGSKFERALRTSRLGKGHARHTKIFNR